MNRRYEDAAEMLNALRPESLDDQGLQTLAMTNVRLGRIEEARKAVKLFLIRDPGQNISFLRVLYDHYLRQADLDDRMEALQVAGIPEWPYGFAGRPENRLDGAAIRAIALDKIWSGRQQEGAPFFMQLGSNGDFAQRAQSGMLVGRFTVEGDLFCVRSDAILLGRRFCSPVYRNVNQDQHFDYVYPDYANVWYFSVSS
jgi:adenylate cyclase